MIKFFLEKTSSFIQEYKEFNRYFFNTSWLLIEKIIRFLSALFLGIWMARLLGPEGFGQFSYIESYVALFMVFSTLGLDSIIIRELVRDQTKKHVLLGTTFMLKLIGAFVLIMLISLTFLFNNNTVETNSLILILSLGTIAQSFNVIDFYFQSQVLSKYVVCVKIFTILLSTVFKSFLLFHQASLFWIIVAFSLDFLMIGIGLLYFYSRKVDSLRNWSFDLNLAKKLLKNSWPLILNGLMVSLYMKTDQVMVVNMLGEEANGQYAAAVRLSEVSYFLPTIIASSVFPAIIQAKKKSMQFYHKRLRQLFSLMTWISILLILPIVLFSDWIIQILYGSSYIEASSILKIHMWSFWFVALGVSSGYWYINEGLEKKAFLRTFFAALLNIILNWIFISEYGIIGVSVVTLISLSFSGLLFDLFFKKTRKLFLMKLSIFF